jgi:hypothetical protein
MAKENKVEELIIQPLKIKTAGLMINESLIPAAQSPIRIDFNHDFSILENSTTALFQLEVLYFLDTENEAPKRVLGCLVDNYFELPNLNNFRNKDGLLMIPPEAFVIIVSLSISHARAVVATHCLGTIFENTLIPIVDPIQVTHSFIASKKNENGYPIKAI